MTKKMPPKKEMIPRNLSLLEKKRIVLERPGKVVQWMFVVACREQWHCEKAIAAKELFSFL
jgi:hypothetical protein